MATIKSLGEDALVALVTKGLAAGSNTLVGPGDDCAVLGSATQRTPLTLFKTDCIVENVHFLPDADPAKVGWKAMARAVSDMAAMGGYPETALVTLVLHSSTSLDFVKGLYRGFRKAERAFGLAIVGGETAGTTAKGGNTISVSMLGKVEPVRCVLRSTAKVGDSIYVTGKLGGSGDGRHLTFRPRLDEARWLSENFTPTAMMDLSDGLAKDLPRLADASQVGYRIDFASIPKNRGVSIERAVGEGEDYELLFTASRHAAKKLESSWRKAFPKMKLSSIGEVLKTPSDRTAFLSRGWEHFS